MLNGEFWMLNGERCMGSGDRGHAGCGSRTGRMNRIAPSAAWPAPDAAEHRHRRKPGIGKWKDGKCMGGKANLRSAECRTTREPRHRKPSQRPRARSQGCCIPGRYVICTLPPVKWLTDYSCRTAQARRASAVPSETIHELRSCAFRSCHAFLQGREFRAKGPTM